MGFTYGDFIMKNTQDATLALQGRIKESEVRQLNTRFFMDTGALNTFITEAEQKVLQLPEWATRLVKVGDGRRVLCKKVGPALIQWQDQDYDTYVYIMPGLEKPILGVHAMEYLD
jgi:predicted aspartyl protease